MRNEHDHPTSHTDTTRASDAQRPLPSLDLRTFAWPKLDGVDIVFGTRGADPALLAEARRRGFYGGHTPYNELFSKLFFSGGAVEFKKDLPEEFRKSAWAYVRSFMGSFAPKHEDKEAICALILSELVEPQLQAKAKS